MVSKDKYSMVMLNDKWSISGGMVRFGCSVLITNGELNYLPNCGIFAILFCNWFRLCFLNSEEVERGGLNVGSVSGLGVL